MMGIFYLDFPAPANPAHQVNPKTDKDNLLIPSESECHTRYPLQVLADQADLRDSVHNEIERSRDDVWFVANDATNVEHVVEDIERSILEFGVPLLEKPYNARDVQIERRNSFLNVNP